MKEKLREGGIYIWNESIFEVIEIENSEKYGWHLSIYDYDQQTNSNGRMSQEDMEFEYKICPPVIVELLK